MRVLVTGGAGFIGSSLVESLLADGEDVVVLDDFSSGRRANLPATHGRLRVVVGSVLDDATVERLVGEVDHVYHLAAAVGVSLVGRAPRHGLEANTLGTLRVLAAAAARGVPTVVASSSEVYGARDAVPYREADAMCLGVPSEVRSGYSCAKAWGECLAFAHAAESGLPVLVVRLFNTVGPRQRARYGMVLPRFARQALAGEPLTVYSDGRQTRCFAHVEDVVSAIRALVARDRFGAVFNVGSEAEVTIGELANCVVRRAGSPSRIEHAAFESHHPGFGGGPRRRVPDLSALRQAIGAVPQRSLDSIIDEVLRSPRSSPLAQPGDSRGTTRPRAPSRPLLRTR